MRAAAERVLNEATQPRDALQTFFLGNGPIGHLHGSDGAVFFHRAQLIKGGLGLDPGSGLTDYAWLNRDEVVTQTPDSALQQLLQRML